MFLTGCFGSIIFGARAFTWVGKLIKFWSLASLPTINLGADTGTGLRLNRDFGIVEGLGSIGLNNDVLDDDNEDNTDDDDIEDNTDDSFKAASILDLAKILGSGSEGFIKETSGWLLEMDNLGRVSNFGLEVFNVADGSNGPKSTKEDDDTVVEAEEADLISWDKICGGIDIVGCEEASEELECDLPWRLFLGEVSSSDSGELSFEKHI